MRELNYILQRINSYKKQIETNKKIAWIEKKYDLTINNSEKKIKRLECQIQLLKYGFQLISNDIINGI